MEDPERFPATKLVYLSDTYLYELSAVLVGSGSGAKGKFLIFNETVFYPKGGGQPSDLGKVQFDDGVSYNVTFVEYDGVSGAVRHYIGNTDDACEPSLESRVGTAVSQHVDADRRLANAKAHTAGHLLADVVASLAPELQGKLGNHDPVEGCYVKFHGLLTSASAAEFPAIVNRKLEEVLQVPRKVDSRSANEDEGGAEGKARRLVQIDGFDASPCGGTHIRSLTEINTMTCTKAKIEKKENVTKISYTIS